MGHFSSIPHLKKIKILKLLIVSKIVCVASAETVFLHGCIVFPIINQCRFKQTNAGALGLIKRRGKTHR